MNFTLNRETKKVMSLSLDVISYQNALTRIISLAKNRTPSYVCFANVHMTIESYNDRSFAQQVNNASLVLPDGVPLVKFLNYFYKCKQERIAGMDLFPDIIRQAEINYLKIFFFGTTPEVLEAIKNKVRERFPKTEIVGLLPPPFDKSLDDETYISTIISSKASLIFVALGCPKQEKWMAMHSHKINGVLLGVGGAFPVFAGLAKRAPVIVQNMGLEWLYRLAQEPKRLFGRYFRTNSKFLYLVLIETIKVGFRKSKINLL